MQTPAAVIQKETPNTHTKKITLKHLLIGLVFRVGQANLE